MNFLIFSKNRAAQLDLLLNSIKDRYKSNISSISILYKRDKEFIQSYEIAKNRCFNYFGGSAVTWVNELVFEQNLINELKSFKNELVCLLTDDTVFFRDFKEESLYSFNSTFSYRLGYNTIIQDEYSGRLQPFLTPDSRIGDIISWNPNKYPPDTNYGYPFSFDGHVYYAEFLLECINHPFKNTNELEVILHNQREKIGIISSNLHSSCVNCPVNNISGWTLSGKNHPLSIDACNKIILSGGILQIPSIPIHACHQEIAFNVI